MPIKCAVIVDNFDNIVTTLNSMLFLVTIPVNDPFKVNINDVEKAYEN